METAIVLLWLASALGLVALATLGRPGMRPVAWLHGGVGLLGCALVIADAIGGGWITILAAAALTLAAGSGLMILIAGRRRMPLSGRLLLLHTGSAILGVILTVLAVAAGFEAAA